MYCNEFSPLDNRWWVELYIVNVVSWTAAVYFSNAPSKYWFHHVYHLELVNEYPLEEDGQQQQMQSIIVEQQWYKQQQGRQIQEQIWRKPSKCGNRTKVKAGVAFSNYYNAMENFPQPVAVTALKSAKKFIGCVRYRGEQVLTDARRHRSRTAMVSQTHQEKVHSPWRPPESRNCNALKSGNLRVKSMHCTCPIYRKYLVMPYIIQKYQDFSTFRTIGLCVNVYQQHRCPCHKQREAPHSHCCSLMNYLVKESSWLTCNMNAVSRWLS